MDVTSAPTEYADGLLFAAEVTEAATRPGHGDHGAEQLKDPYVQELLRCQGNWSWCDNRLDVDVAAGGALRATVDYVARRHALSLSHAVGHPRQLCPNLDERLAALARALEFAAASTEQAWPHELSVVLGPWLRRRLALLLQTPAQAEGMAAFEARVRHAVTVTHRYRITRYELFGDRHWTGRPDAPWWCPDADLAARSPFHAHTSDPVPAYAVRLDESSGAHRTGELTVVTAHARAPQTYPFVIVDGVPTLPPDADIACRDATHAALAALHGVAAAPGP